MFAVYVQGGTDTLGSWAADRVAILRKDVEAAHMSAEQWGDALDFGLHNFFDIGASVQRMLVAGETTAQHGKQLDFRHASHVPTRCGQLQYSVHAVLHRSFPFGVRRRLCRCTVVLHVCSMRTLGFACGVPAD